jgi:hypothetical protein
MLFIELHVRMLDTMRERGCMRVSGEEEPDLCMCHIHAHTYGTLGTTSGFGYC